jgi:hypothetical protein
MPNDALEPNDRAAVEGLVASLQQDEIVRFYTSSTFDTLYAAHVAQGRNEPADCPFQPVVAVTVHFGRLAAPGTQDRVATRLPRFRSHRPGNLDVFRRSRHRHVSHRDPLRVVEQQREHS